MIDCKVALLVNGCKLKLVGGGLVVTGFCGDSQLHCLYFEVLHKGCHTGGYRAEIVVLELLVFSTVVPHKGAPCEQQIGAGEQHTLIYKKILLLPTKIGGNFLYILVEITAHIGGRFIYRTKRFKQRRLIVERLACI